MEDAVAKILARIDKTEDLVLEGTRLVRPQATDFFRLPGGERTAITCIDGGSATVIYAPEACVLFCRVVTLTMDATFAKTIGKEECFILARPVRDAVTVERIGLDGAIEELATVPLTEDGLPAAADLGRKLLEWRAAARAAESANARQGGTTVVWDGCFTTRHDVEREALGTLDDVLGVSKTTGAVGRFRDFFIAAPQEAWTVLVGRPAGDPTDRSILFAKLHPEARHIFRIDIREGPKATAVDAPDAGEEMMTEAIARVAKLVPWSTDATFLGYPYPLILVDQLARISNQEATALRIQCKALAGVRWERLGVEAKDAHGILDRMQY